MKSKWLGSAAAGIVAAAMLAAPVMAKMVSPATTPIAGAVADDDAGADAGGAVSEPQPLSFGTWGVDLDTRDTSVKPGDDFQAYANGKWYVATPIPADQPSAGVDYDVFNLTQDQLRAVVGQAPADSQVGGLYKSFIDEARVEALGAKPLMANLAAVDALADKTAFARFMGGTQGRFGISIVGGSPYADPADPTINALWMGQGGARFARTRILFRRPVQAAARRLYRLYRADAENDRQHRSRRRRQGDPGL